MNWLWFRSRHRRVISAGGMNKDSAGQPSRGPTARRVGYAWLGVVLAAAAGCTGSPGRTGQGQAAAAAASSVFVSKTAPGAPVGRQLTWFLRAVGQLPWSRRVIEAHFGAGFLAQSSPVKDAPEDGIDVPRACGSCPVTELICAGLLCARKAAPK